MSWQQRDPFGEAIANAVGVAGGIAQGKANQKEAENQRKRQEAQDKAAAVAAAQQARYQQSQIDRNTAETGKITTDEQDKNRREGVGLTDLPEMPKNHGTPLGARALATYYGQLAATYAKHGAWDGANQYTSLAKQQEEIADKNDASVLAARKEKNVEIETQARIHHWTAQEKQAVQQEADRVYIAAQHDQTSLAVAQTHLNAVIGAANINASSRLQGIGMQQAGEDRRFNLGEQGREKRAKMQQQGLDTRFNAGQKNQAAREGAAFSVSNPNASAPPIPVYTIGGQGGGRGGAGNVPMNIKMLIKSAVQNGHSANDILASPELRQYNLTPADVQSIATGK